MYSTIELTFPICSAGEPEPEGEPEAEPEGEPEPEVEPEPGAEVIMKNTRQK